VDSFVDTVHARAPAARPRSEACSRGLVHACTGPARELGGPVRHTLLSSPRISFYTAYRVRAWPARAAPRCVRRPTAGVTPCPGARGSPASGGRRARAGGAAPHVPAGRGARGGRRRPARRPQQGAARLPPGRPDRRAGPLGGRHHHGGAGACPLRARARRPSPRAACELGAPRGGAAAGRLPRPAGLPRRRCMGLPPSVRDCSGARRTACAHRPVRHTNRARTAPVSAGQAPHASGVPASPQPRKRRGAARRRHQP